MLVEEGYTRKWCGLRKWHYRLGHFQNTKSLGCFAKRNNVEMKFMKFLQFMIKNEPDPIKLRFGRCFFVVVFVFHICHVIFSFQMILFRGWTSRNLAKLLGKRYLRSRVMMIHSINKWIARSTAVTGCILGCSPGSFWKTLDLARNLFEWMFGTERDSSSFWHSKRNSAKQQSEDAKNTLTIRWVLYELYPLKAGVIIRTILVIILGFKLFWWKDSHVDLFQRGRLKPPRLIIQPVRSRENDMTRSPGIIGWFPERNASHSNGWDSQTRQSGRFRQFPSWDAESRWNKLANGITLQTHTYVTPHVAV